jgi:hypothetical protein
MKDIAEGSGMTSLPPSLARKYPSAVKEFKWQYLFPSTTRCEHLMMVITVGTTFTVLLGIISGGGVGVGLDLPGGLIDIEGGGSAASCAVT